MRLLNKTFAPTAKVRRAYSLLHTFISHGRRFILDRNSLAVAEVTETEAQMANERLQASLLFNCPYQPVEQRTEQSPRFLILNLTNRCNLRCSYCFVSPQAYQKTMPMETVMRALSLLDTPSPDIGLFGGEPTLVGANYLRWIMEHAERRFQTPRFHITTNGTLITDEIALALAKHKVSAIVSIDGGCRIHDLARSGSWGGMMRGLHRLRGAGVKPITGRATFTPYSLKLKERIEFLGKLVCDGLLDSISIEPAALRPEQEWSYNQLANEWEEMAEYLSQNPDVLKVFGTLQTLIKRVRDGAPQVRNCGAGNGYITVAPEGTIHACHREASPIGDVINGFDDRRKLWINPLEPKECSVCWARYLCGGGCHATRRFELHCQQCVPNRIQAMEAVWLLSERG